MKKISIAMYLCRKQMARYDQLLRQAEALWQKERSEKVSA
jgi:hypothetical protein